MILFQCVPVSMQEEKLEPQAQLEVQVEKEQMEFASDWAWSRTDTNRPNRQEYKDKSYRAECNVIVCVCACVQCPATDQCPGEDDSCLTISRIWIHIYTDQYEALTINVFCPIARKLNK